MSHTRDANSIVDCISLNDVNVFVRLDVQTVPQNRLKIKPIRPLPRGVVGRGGLEPPTSRLSGVRSNHLSYRPVSVRAVCMSGGA